MIVSVTVFVNKPCIGGLILWTFFVECLCLPRAQRRCRRWPIAVRTTETDEDEIDASTGAEATARPLARPVARPLARTLARPLARTPCADPGASTGADPGAHIPELTRSQARKHQRVMTTWDVPHGKRLRVKTTPHASLCMPGLNIQWPFSQLILLGVKTEEIRTYALDTGRPEERRRYNAKPNQEVWIVETPGLTNRLKKDVIVGDVHIPPRPIAAHIVGTVTFSYSHQYTDKNTFHDARNKHCIAQASQQYDWEGTSDCFGWHVSKVRALTTPIPVESKGMTGFGPRYYPAIFAWLTTPSLTFRDMADCSEWHSTGFMLSHLICVA